MVLYEGMKEYMEDKFISEFFELDDELDELGVFDSIMNKDSHFFINILRLKKSKTPQLSVILKFFIIELGISILGQF